MDKYEIYKVICPTGETYVGQHLNHRYPERDGYWGSGSLINMYYNTHLEFSESEYQYVVLHTVDTLEEANILETKEIFNSRKIDKEKNLNIANGGQQYPNLGSVNKGHIWYNNGHIQIHCLPENKPEGWVEGMLPSIYRGHAIDGKLLYNNGIEQHYYYENMQPDGYKLGGLGSSMKGCWWATNGIDNSMFFSEDEFPDETWHWGTAPGTIGGDTVSGKLLYNNGVEQHYYYEGEQPDGYILGSMVSSPNKGKYAATNGIDIIYISSEDEFPDSNWHWGVPYVEGKDSIDGLMMANNGIEQHFFDPSKELPEGYTWGKIPGSIYNYNKCYATNGIIEDVFSDESEFPDSNWHWGRLLSIEGCKMYNNGIKQGFYKPGTEPEGWTLGYINHNWATNLGKKMYNNGIEQHYFVVGKEPEGYKLGKLPD